MIAHPNGGDLAADALHHARQLMPQHHRGLHICRAFIPVIDMHIRAADAAGGHLHQHIPLPQWGNGLLPHFKLAVAQKIIASHGLFLPGSAAISDGSIVSRI